MLSILNNSRPQKSMWPGTEPTPSAPEAKVLTPGPLGESQLTSLTVNISPCAPAACKIFKRGSFGRTWYKHRINLLFTFQSEWSLKSKGKTNLKLFFFLTNPGRHLASSNYGWSDYYLLIFWKITFSKDSMFISTRMAITKCWRGYKETGTLMHC